MEKAIKALGQNFLKDQSVAIAIVESLDLQPNDTIVEIGGGTGALTKILLQHKFKKLFVYEIDKKLASELSRLTKGREEVQIICENFLDADLESLPVEYKVIGAIPYYITSPIIHKLFRLQNRAEQIALLIQKEVAEKILSGEPKANYWSNVLLGYTASLIQKVPAEAFYPIPKVKSAIILLTKNIDDEKLLLEIGFNKWSKFLHHAFKNQRKMLHKTFPRTLLESIGIKENLRPHNLSKHDWIDVLRFSETKWHSN